ncbi:MAG: conjugal transfer protein TraF, partial [Acidobacteria bacterium]|nr:conjugal transfer protein TraF [Acidobacteriota bacterium]
MVRVRLEARAHPAAAGARAARHPLVRLPRPHRRGDRGNRLRKPRPLGVRPGPHGRLKRALGRASRRRGHARRHAHAHRRLLPEGAMTVRTGRRPAVASGAWLVALLAAALVAFGIGSAPAGEWRSWCSVPESGQAGGNGASLGWHFYCDRDDGPDPEPEPEMSAPPEATDPETPATERILEIRRALEEARAEAVLDPTPEKVTAYLRLQQETLQRAAAFSDAFRRTVWATPDVDYTLVRPVGALAKRVWSDGRREARDVALARLGERYGLIYLGHTGCASCRVFGPLLRAFAERHGLDVLAVSLTGEALEG